MKNALIWTGSVIGVGAVLALLFGWLDKPETPRVISVNGECLTSAPKDRTAITLRVTTLDKSAATSMKMATAKINEITNYLKTQDVQMQTTEFNSYERSEWNRELEKSVVLGTETTIAIEVSADNIETIEKILTQFAGQEDCRKNVKRFIQCWRSIHNSTTGIKFSDCVRKNGGCRCRGFFRRWQHCCQGYRGFRYRICNI